MRNPYEVLEINENSSKDDIKKAYRELTKKYHPDQYGNNPLRDLAEEKMIEINEAYDYLMKNSNVNGNNNYENSYNSSTGNSYQDIRMDIQSGNYAVAEQKLNSISTHDAEWNYLMGVIAMKKGWYDAAYNSIRTACSLDPSNIEYKDAFTTLNNRGNSYRQNYYGNRGNDSDLCNICTTLWCADALCECFGGDFISCC